MLEVDNTAWVRVCKEWVNAREFTVQVEWSTCYYNCAIAYCLCYSKQVCHSVVISVEEVPIVSGECGSMRQ